MRSSILLAVAVLLLSLASLLPSVHAEEPCPSLPTPVVLPDAAEALGPALDAWDTFLAEQVAAHDVNGFVSIVVYDQQVLWSKGYGKQNFTDPNSPPPTADSIVRIASLTKLMTTQLLVNLVGQGVVRYDTPLEKCMPGFSIRTLPEQKTRNARPITLRSLAAQMSGLPREQPCPWSALCTEAQVLEALAPMFTLYPVDSQAHYSNLGFSLLGRCLEHAYAQVHPTGGNKNNPDVSAAPSYEQLTEQLVWRSIGMDSSTFALNETLLSRLAVGRNDEGEAAPIADLSWDNPCGGAMMSSTDMATYMSWLFRTTQLPDPSPAAAKAGAPLDSSNNEFFQEISVLPDGLSGFGLTWELNYSTVLPAWTYLKAGELSGYRSQVALVPELKFGVFNIALQSSAPDPTVWAMKGIENLGGALRDLLKVRQPAPAVPVGGQKLVADFVGGASVWIDGTAPNQRMLVGPTPAHRAAAATAASSSMRAASASAAAASSRHHRRGSGAPNPGLTCQLDASWPGDLLLVTSIVGGASSASSALRTVALGQEDLACRWLDDGSMGELVYLTMDPKSGKPASLAFMGQIFCAIPATHTAAAVTDADEPLALI